VQSWELCFPFKSLLARNSKELYNNHFGDFFDYVQANGIAGGAVPRACGVYTEAAMYCQNVLILLRIEDEFYF
jgi:hypothetical protein